MNRKYSYNHDEAILYLVATPIGNLEDMTFRAVRILKSVDIIYAEDTRNSKLLCNHYDIKTPLYSYHDFNKEIKNDEIISFLKSGKNIAIISDAGLPVISDPGYNIALSAIMNNIAVTTIPGASAYISALVSSGLPPMPNTFIGFLDSKTSKRRSELEKFKYNTNTLIFYESPHRIVETLKDMEEVLGDRYIVIARELTKKFEEYIRGYISEIIKDETPWKGEMVVLVKGYEEKVEEDIDYIKKIEEMIKLGLKNKEAIKEVALMYNLDKKELYSSYVKYMDENKLH